MNLVTLCNRVREGFPIKRILMALACILTMLFVYLYIDVWLYVQALPPALAQAEPVASQLEDEVPIFPDLEFKSIVRTKGIYDYETMLQQLHQLIDQYKLLTVDIIGKSVEGRAIYLVKLGHGSKKVLLDGAHHGNEWISSFLLMTMIEHYAYYYHTGLAWDTYDVRSLLGEYTLYIVPMVNPDGVDIVATNGRSSLERKALVRMNGGSNNFAGWKANARGVDLNRQYPTNWPLARSYGPKVPARANYAGPEPLSEPEIVAMCQLHESQRFAAHLTYHSVGNVLYYYYYQKGAQLQRDRSLVEAVSSHTGYSVRHGSGGIGGMARDHVVTTYQIPCIIVELGQNKARPLPEFASIWEKNCQVPLLVIRWLQEYLP